MPKVNKPKLATRYKPDTRSTSRLSINKGDGTYYHIRISKAIKDVATAVMDTPTRQNLGRNLADELFKQFPGIEMCVYAELLEMILAKLLGEFRKTGRVDVDSVELSSFVANNVAKARQNANYPSGHPMSKRPRK